MSKLLWIAAGGALGALLRYGVAGLAHRLLGPTFPWGTLAANLIGCFLIGFLWASADRMALSPNIRLFVFTGAIGALTTFSTYGLESIHLLREGEIALGAANIILSNVLGLALVAAGFACAHPIIRLFATAETAP